MNVEAQLIEFIRTSLKTADAAFVEDFVSNGPIPGGKDGGTRYLLAVALHEVNAEKLAAIAGISLPTAQHLKTWLDRGTRA
jgi:hypothetical protein